VAFIAHPRLHELLRRHPGLVTALWRETLIDAAIYREWMVNLGRRAAGQRLAHMICEMDARFAAVGLNHAHSFELPLTQMELGDALGLSAVHVNRVLQELRGAGLLDYDGGRVTIRNWEGLKAAGEFDPAYLHLRRGPA
jgi:CRP-like cAMP-binding protein